MPETLEEKRSALKGRKIIDVFTWTDANGKTWTELALDDYSLLLIRDDVAWVFCDPNGAVHV